MTLAKKIVSRADMSTRAVGSIVLDDTLQTTQNIKPAEVSNTKNNVFY